METKAVCGRGTGSYNGGSDVPAVADEAKDRGMVFKHGNARADRAILRNGHFPTDTILRHGVRSATGAMAVSEPFRGRWIF